MTISEFIYSWIKDLVLLFVIITLVELVMPKGSMRRYINFVVGLLIIFTVINPFINLTNLDFQLDREVFRNIDNQYDNEEAVIDGQESQIESLYKEKIAREVIDFVEDNTEYRISRLNVEINKDEENFGLISHLSIWVYDEDIEVDENNIDIQVEPVILEHNPMKQDMDRNEFVHVKDLISDRYEIDKDLIDISINKMED